MFADISTILSTLKQEVDPQLSYLFDEFESLYDSKLWHQLTEKLELFFQDERTGPLRLRVYDAFVLKFQDKISQLSVVSFLLSSLKAENDPEAALGYLEDLRKSFKEIDAKKQRNDGLKSHFDGVLLIDIEIARFHLTKGDLVKSRDSLDAIEATIELQDVMPLEVTSAFYSASSEYYQAKRDFNSFYYTSLLYLSTAEASRSVPEFSFLRRQQLAYDLSIAALLGDKIYNFGELLHHPIMESISSDPQYEWLFQFLNTLSSGDFDQFDKISKQRVSQVPILSTHESFLRQKICLMTLVESVFVKNIRTLSFQDIASATHLPKDNVEHLVMRSISLGLLKGSIDQVQELVTVTWVQPRIINADQINKMKQRLVEWNSEVSNLGRKIEARGKSIWV